MSGKKVLAKTRFENEMDLYDHFESNTSSLEDMGLAPNYDYTRAENHFSNYRTDEWGNLWIATLKVNMKLIKSLKI